MKARRKRYLEGVQKLDKVSVRPARAEDESAIGDLLVASFNETYARKMPEVKMTDRRRQELRGVAAMRDRVLVLVEELAGEIVGTVTLYPPGAQGGHAWASDFAELRFLALDPKRQGQGLAEPLVAECLKVAQEWKAAGICLHVRRGAEGVARFYEKRGWVRIPEGDKNHLPEVYLEAYLLTFGPR